MPPSVDPFSPKNQDLEPATVEGILGKIGLGAKRAGDRADLHAERTGRPAGSSAAPSWSRRSRCPRGPAGCPGLPLGPAEGPARGARVLRRYLDDPAIHLALVGPATGAICRRPRGRRRAGGGVAAWRRLPDDSRRRAHLVSLPMFDLDENGAMVNAIQRRADVLVQKSIAEGFGMTVAEGMWKERAVVGSRVGGIQDQIVDGECGVLIDDPGDLEGFGLAIRGLLDDPARAERLGKAARQRIRDGFLSVHRLIAVRRPGRQPRAGRRLGRSRSAVWADHCPPVEAALSHSFVSFLDPIQREALDVGADLAGPRQLEDLHQLDPAAPVGQGELTLEGEGAKGVLEFPPASPTTVRWLSNRTI